MFKDDSAKNKSNQFSEQATKQYHDHNQKISDKNVDEDFITYAERLANRCNAFLSRIMNDCTDSSLSTTTLTTTGLITTKSANTTPATKYNNILLDAMCYSIFNGGKRIRPILVYTLGSALGISEDKLDAVAASIELIHCYSLIHDDLPAMDNDDLRRGKPTCHKAFNEAIAILSGDALQTLAFETLANSQYNPFKDEIKIKMILALTRAAGCLGMAGGQAIDIAITPKTGKKNEDDLNNDYLKNYLKKNDSLTPLNSIENSIDLLIQLNKLKTGALIIACVQMTTCTIFHLDEKRLLALENFACCLGLAYQIQDDILDITGHANTLGKTKGKDAAANKLTFPALMGLENAKKTAADIHLNALNFLSQAFPNHKDLPKDIAIHRLTQLADYFIHRTM